LIKLQTQCNLLREIVLWLLEIFVSRCTLVVFSIVKFSFLRFPIFIHYVFFMFYKFPYSYSILVLHSSLRPLFPFSRLPPPVHTLIVPLYYLRHVLRTAELSLLRYKFHIASSNHLPPSMVHLFYFSIPHISHMPD